MEQELVFSKRYNEIIAAAKKRGWTKKIARQLGIKTEKHHIMPKSLYPELANKKSNKVELTEYEHLVVHLELALKNPSCKQMINAAYNMLNTRNLSIVDEEYVQTIAMVREQAVNNRSGSNSHFFGKEPVNKGKHHTDETRKKMSENHADVSGENNPRYGVSVDLETRIKISNGHNKKGTRITDIVCDTTGEYFKTAYDVHLKYNLKTSSMLECCRGENNRRSLGKLNGQKLVWRFATEEEIEKLKKGELTYELA